MKAKTLTKIMSSVLCAALTMQIGFGLRSDRTSAASTDYSYDETTNTTTFSSDGSRLYFDIRKNIDDVFEIYSYTNITEHYQGTFHDGCNIVINSNCIVCFECNANVLNVTLRGGAGDGTTNIADLTVKENITLTIAGNIYCYTSTSPDEMPNNEISLGSGSNLYVDKLDLSSLYNLKEFLNKGSIYAKDINLGKTFEGHISYVEIGECYIYATDSFANSSNDINAVVNVNSDTFISSEGGAFTFQVSHFTKNITGTLSETKVADFFDDPISFDNVPDVYYGQDYDFSNLIDFADGYDGSVYLEYSTEYGSNYTTDKPTAQSSNNYYVRAVASDSDTYLGKTTDPQPYKINYLEYSDLFPSGSKAYSSVSGIVNGKYVPGDLVITMPNGILIKGDTFDSDKDFSNTITLTPEVVLNDYGGVNVDETVQFRDTNNDNATTEGNISIAQFYPELLDLVYDLYDPDIWLSSVDGEFVDEDITTSLTGDDLEFRIYDDNLKAIYVNGELYKSFEEGHFISPIEEDDYFPDDEEGFEPEYITLSLSSVVGKATDYTIKAVDYAGRETEFSFTLFPNTTDALISVTVPEGPIYAGDDYDVDVKTNSDGKVTLQYKDADTNTVLSSKPTAAGNYTVTATSAKTTFYFEAKDSADFTIIKRTPDTTVTVPGIVYVGNDYEVEANTDSDGNITYQYYDKDNGTYLSSKPTSAGEYTVTAKTAETTKYYSSEDTASFKIVKRDPTISLSVPDTIVGQTYAPEFVTNSDSNSITFEYKVKGAADSTYTKTRPTAAGSYTIRVTVGSTDKFNEASATDNFTISKKAASVSLGVGTPYAGTTYTPSFSSNSDAASRAVFEYKEKNADDSKYSKTAPNTVGTYVVRVTIPETENYAETIVTADFRIIYLNAPQTAYVIEGQSGKNNFYVSDVVLKAPAGFTISAVYGGPYTASIPYNDGITSVYLKRTSDGALTNAISIANAPRVDKSAPSISTPNGTIAPGSVIYTSDFTLNVSDPNLRSLKVNGEPIDLTNYKNGYSLTLNPGYGSQTYKIMAEDEAGNVTTLEFTLKAEWLKNKVIIPDVVLPLEGNESYNLGEGYWLVTRNTPDGPVTDNTVYSGNMPFYVKEGGDYTFTKVT